jgi:hypothetical protein
LKRKSPEPAKQKLDETSIGGDPVFQDELERASAKTQFPNFFARNPLKSHDSAK